MEEQLTRCSWSRHEEPQTARTLNPSDLVGHRCPQLVQFDRHDHVNCSLSVEDASHVLCVSHDA